MADYFSITIVVIIFILSLAGAYVLFKLLKSTAVIKKTGYQAGGALAGFLLIYGMLFYSYDKMAQSNIEVENALWTITGTVKRENSPKHDGISIRHVPPAPNTYTDASGFFRLENVRSSTADSYPEIYIENDGYFPLPISIADSNAIIDKEKKTIKLRGELMIYKVIE